MNKIVITSDTKRVFVVTNDFSTYFNNSVEVTYNKSCIIKIELFNTENDDYVEIKLADGAKFQMNHSYIDNIDGVAVNSNKEFYDIIKLFVE